MLPSVLTLLDFAASGVAVADTGAQGVMPFPFGLLDGASDTGVTPTPTPTPTAPSGGWVYDPYSRRRRRRDDDDEPPPSVPVIVPDRPRVDIAALDAKIAALGEQIQRSRRGRIKLREQLRALEVERAIQIGLERRLRLLRDDDEWFLLS